MQFFNQEDYLPLIESTYLKLEKKLHDNLIDVEIEHIGSSAIKDAISKGDLDILVRSSKENFNINLNTIIGLDFNIKTNTLRTDSLCMLETQKYPIDVAIQLIESGSEFEDFVKFRNLLNGDPRLVIKYNELKNNSTDLSPDEYRSIKSKFIQLILKG
jgi:GrpB-like predicted nucleotidyltransferase (UPF0157 family)